jgi:transposase-like protein
MRKGRKNKKYTGEFKQQVVEDMIEKKISYSETARKYELPNHHIPQKWERIYLEEGVAGLNIERRGRGASASVARKGRAPKLEKKVEEDLIAENQRLRMEIDYLKKLNALVQKREQRERKRR